MGVLSRARRKIFCNARFYFVSTRYVASRELFQYAQAFALVPAPEHHVVVQIMVKFVHLGAFFETGRLWDFRVVRLVKRGRKSSAPRHPEVRLVMAVIHRRVEDARLSPHGSYVAAPEVAVQERRFDLSARAKHISQPFI